jgi:hypothetical protein
LCKYVKQTQTVTDYALAGNRISVLPPEEKNEDHCALQSVGLFYLGLRMLGGGFAAAQMKTRHAAAVVLVGWYLMVPSITYQSAANVWTVSGFDQHKRPVYSAWENYGSYDTAAECQEQLSKLDPTASPIMPTAEGAVRNPTGLASAVRDSVKQAVCIPDNDPRLKD